MIRVLTGGALAVVLVAVLAGCTPASRAEQRADFVARLLADELTPRTPEALDAEYYAQRAVAHSQTLDPFTRVETLGWSGRLGEDEEAVVTLRLSVELPEVNNYGFSRREGPSSAVRCWDLVLRFLHDYDPRAWELREVPCPDGAAALTPDPVPLASMPDDVEERLTAVLADATAADAEARVRTEFDDPGWTVVVEERDGMLALALGAELERSCAVGVRHPDGVVEVLRGFSPESLLPGEIGCHPMLYFGGYTP